MTIAESSLSMHELYSEHHGWLQGYLRKRLGCNFRAADLVQDTYVRILAKTDISSIQEPRAFLTTVAQRVLSNFYRREALEKAYAEVLSDQFEEETPTVEEQAIVLEALLMIDDLLDGLAIPIRQAFLLSQLDGLSHAKIAKELDINIKTVKRYIVKAGMHCYFSH